MADEINYLILIALYLKFNDTVLFM